MTSRSDRHGKELALLPLALVGHRSADSPSAHRPRRSCTVLLVTRSGAEEQAHALSVEFSNAIAPLALANSSEWGFRDAMGWLATGEVPGPACGPLPVLV